MTLACRGGFKSIIMSLLNFGAKYNEPDLEGLTPLQHISLPYREPPPSDTELPILRDLSAHYRTLCKNPNYSDCSFQTELGNTIPAHRAILLARCPQLHSLVAADPAGKVNIAAYGFTQPLFIAILEFLYCGTIEFENSELELQFAFQLMAKAQEFQINSLSTYCESFVLTNMDSTTVSLVLDVARQHKVASVEEYCSWFALKHIYQVLQAQPLTQQHVIQIVGQVPFTATAPTLDNFDKTPTLSAKVDPYTASSSTEGYGGLSSSGGVKPPKPKAPKPKKPADGNFSPPGPAPKKQKVATPGGSYGPPSAVSGLPLASPGRPKVPSNLPFDAFAGANQVHAKKLLKDIKEVPDCLPFLYPVDVDAYNIPDYKYIIQRPIDISTIAKSKAYKTVKQWAADIRRIWENARIYNAETSPFNSQAVTMSSWFEAQYAAMKQQCGLPAGYDPTPAPKPREWYAEQYAAGLKRFQDATGQILQPASNIPPHAPPSSSSYQQTSALHNPMQQQPRPPQAARPVPSPSSIPPPVARPPQQQVPPKPQPQQPPKRKADSITPGPYDAPLGANGMGSVQHAPMHHGQVGAPHGAVQHQPVAPPPLTPEELEDLSGKLNNLDTDQITKVIEILQLQPNANGEYEINVTELDARTLRKLQTFVNQELGGAPAAKRPAF